MNQASKESFDVPVLPASGRPSAAARTPVPRSTTPLSAQTVWNAEAGSVMRGRSSTSRGGRSGAASAPAHAAQSRASRRNTVRP